MLRICEKKRAESVLLVISICLGFGLCTSCCSPRYGNGGAQFNQELRTVQSTFQSLWGCSDFVVLAVPISSQDTGGQETIKGFGKSIACKRSLTTFSVLAVLKGDATVKQFSLLHYQEATVSETAFPYFARFNVQEPIRMGGVFTAGGTTSYLLYLKAVPQDSFNSGNAQMTPFDWVDYVPATGQELSGLSVCELHWNTNYDY